MSLFNWEWVARNWGAILERTWEHIFLTGVAVLVGTLIAIGLAVVAVRRRRWYGPITSATNILYTIPFPGAVCLSGSLYGVVHPYVRDWPGRLHPPDNRAQHRGRH